MRVLLDTHVLIWALMAPRRLPADAREVIETSASEVLFSAAGILEIAIKASLGRRDFDFPPAEIADEAVRAGFVELAVRASAAARVGDLPWHHRDPFDRLLVAQALDEPAQLLTADRALAPYSELVWVLR
jgi:PIN domain nuclease of toxin-antitoxin system